MRQIERPWFEFAGKRNTDMGVLMVNMPIREHPVMSGDKVTIDGRDGFMFVSANSYKPISIQLDVVVPDARNIPRVEAWLNGAGELRFFDEPGHVRDAMILTGYKRTNVAKRLEGQKFTVQWTCQPFRRQIGDPGVVLTAPGTIAGQGDVKASPLLILEGNGTATLTVNGDTVEAVLVAGEPLYIDTDAGVAYTMDGDTMIAAGERVSIPAASDWITLGPGENRVTEMTHIGRLTIRPRWRWF